MRVSIITVCFNSSAHIGDALGSVDEQLWPDLEHLIIDGKSTDRTLEVVDRYPQPWRRVISESDFGIYDAMNKGLALATGDVVGFLNSDDMYADPKVIERVAKAFCNPEIDVVYGDLVFVARKNIDKVIRTWTSCAYSQGLCRRGWMPPHPTLFVRRNVYEKFGGYDTSFPAAADFEMALRLLEKAQLRSVYIPVIQVRMRMGGQSTRSIRSIVSGNVEVSRACQKHGFKGGLCFAILRLLSKVPQFLRRP